ncbi:MAG: hypothetical protein ACSW8D_13815 [Prevotella sp.]
MKKKTLMLLTLFVGVLNAWADNTVSVGTALIPQGKTGSFSIELTNTDAFASSLEIHLTLPEGIYFESVSLSDRFTDNPTVGSNANGQAVTITTLSTTNAAISGNQGSLLFVTVSADETLEVGTKLTASITQMELAKKVNGKHEKFNPDPFDFEIEITDRVVLDENSTIAPTPQSGVNVLVKRTIRKDTWSTIVLPFTLSKTKAEAAFGSDVQLAEFTGFEVDYGDDEENVVPLGIVINLADYTMTSRKGMTGGKPFLIKVSENIESFEADGVNITGLVNDVITADENDTPGRLTGSFVKTTIPEDGLFISNNKFWYSTGKTAIKAFRCWFMLDAVLNKETEFESRIFLNFSSEPTGIVEKEKMERLKETQIYDLQGRRIAKPSKGLYIRNGRKEVIK